MTEPRPVCEQHSGVIQALGDLGKSLDKDREATREKIDQLRVEMKETNAWLQQITMKALTRWSPGSVKAIVLVSTIAGALLSALVVVLLFIAKGR